MDIVLEDMKLPAKIKLLDKILKGIDAHVENTGKDEECLDYMLSGLIDYLDTYGDDDFWGTEGWQHAFGVSS